MQVEMLKSKIHRVKVTGANLDYIGSITVDKDLLDASGILPGERVYIVDNNNGERFDTYTIAGEPGSGIVCLNGAAARRVQPGDIIIIMSYATMTIEEARTFQPSVIFPDTDTNKLIK
ncbi:MAG: aspartate 1-decarboxylase [Paramuribaculum sp.]|nr:aspartate 1-decarboxylase [Paramuribaculum sp.]